MKIFLLLASVLLISDTGTLTRIVDGDIFYFTKDVQCRIKYIDTPESYNNNKLKKDISKCKVSNKDMISAGKSAIGYASRLVTVGKQYEYETKGKDHDGRYICIVKNGDTTFNKQMLQGGYASIFRSYKNKDELQYYENLLDTAKNDKVGLWGSRVEVMQCLDKARK